MRQAHFSMDFIDITSLNDSSNKSANKDVQSSHNEDPIATNESLDNQIESLINSNNFETRISMAFNHLNEMINLTSGDLNLSTVSYQNLNNNGDDIIKIDLSILPDSGFKSQLNLGESFFIITFLY